MNSVKGWAAVGQHQEARWRFGVLALVGALCFFACGSDDAGSNSAGGGSGGATGGTAGATGGTGGSAGSATGGTGGATGGTAGATGATGGTGGSAGSATGGSAGAAGALEIAAPSNDWMELDLFEIAPASGAVDYALASGTPPAGLSFMTYAGLLHGVPTTSGTTDLVFTRTANGAVTPIPVRIIVGGAGSGEVAPRAFASAIGFGRYATGGRDQKLYRVTKLSESATDQDSLPWAIAQAKTSGGGYILIEAEGPLELTDWLDVDASNVTIDARRAPGLGMWLNGSGARISASNVVLRHVRSYPGSNFIGASFHGRDAFAINVPGAQDRVYLDRCDAMFSLDEAVSVYPYKPGATTSDVTFHGMFIAEPCHENLHMDEGTEPGTADDVVDDHGKAFLTSQAASDVTFYGGLLASGDDRMPRLTGQSQEFISTVMANYGSTGIQVTAESKANFINCFFMLGDRPGAPTTSSSKWVQGATSTTLQVVYEKDCFSGAWTQAGGFDDAAMRDEWRNQTSASTYMEPSAISNPSLFDRSGADVGALSHAEAFLTLPDRVGAINALGERHPLAKRVMNYVTAPVPFRAAEGWFGTAYGENMIPDEVRAIGAVVTAPGAGQLRVTLPVANEVLPPVTGRAWTGVDVTVVNAYTGPVVKGTKVIPRTSNDWSDGVTLPGDLAGGAVNFTGLPAGFYAARITYTAGNVPVKLYTGRPVAVSN